MTPVGRVVGEDWYGRVLEGVTYRRTEFVDVDLTEVTTRGAVFDECVFRRCRFNASVHEDSAFPNGEFAFCRFFDARFEGCKLTGTTFASCEFELLSVSRGDWRFVGLAGAGLGSATFRGVRMGEADLRGLRGAGVVLAECDLALADLDGADLTGADLRGSDLVSLDPRRVTLTRAVVSPGGALALATNLGLDIRYDAE